MNDISYTAITTNGDEVQIVDKEPLGTQGTILLTDIDGEKYVSDLSGLEVKPLAEADGEVDPHLPTNLSDQSGPEIEPPAEADDEADFHLPTDSGDVR